MVKDVDSIENIINMKIYLSIYNSLHDNCNFSEREDIWKLTNHNYPSGAIYNSILNLTHSLIIKE